LLATVLFESVLWMSDDLTEPTSGLSGLQSRGALAASVLRIAKVSVQLQVSGRVPWHALAHAINLLLGLPGYAWRHGPAQQLVT